MAWDAPPLVPHLVDPHAGRLAGSRWGIARGLPGGTVAQLLGKLLALPPFSDLIDLPLHHHADQQSQEAPDGGPDTWRDG